LLAHIENMQNEGFLYNDWKEQLTVVNDPLELIKEIVN
jgi:hypothetical protein